MVKEHKRDFDQPILYFCPTYLPQGDGTIIMYTNGDQYTDSRNIRSIRRALCRYYALDYSALRSKWRNHCNIGLAPLLLAPGYVLIPVKTRIARCKGDPCYAFVNLHYIDSVLACGEQITGSTILFKNGARLGCHNGLKNIKNKMLAAKAIERIYCDSRYTNQGLEEVFYRIIEMFKQEKGS
ncbi:hypothetical protein Dred_1739 [Desulforamulus reducens MI-1]|uniref:Uncharacterized protein n=1 Tax=Desulforamulus reducens (strain ATCC BAA-1160 / DSM 100696 / MI-1) TaxID=349161 RepID=A4J5B1_DESRM|nr:hypothetical protein [Desulforamulus reducens]ABO50264.1 hypothetical protein Dred_1739 [Desulforamulus reducens MI-1]